MFDMSSDHKRCIKSRHHMFSQIIASSIPQVFSSLDSIFPLPQYWMTDSANTSDIRNHGVAVRKYINYYLHLTFWRLRVFIGTPHWLQPCALLWGQSSVLRWTPGGLTATSSTMYVYGGVSASRTETRNKNVNFGQLLLSYAQFLIEKSL